MEKRIGCISYAGTFQTRSLNMLSRSCRRTKKIKIQALEKIKYIAKKNRPTGSWNKESSMKL